MSYSVYWYQFSGYKGQWIKPYTKEYNGKLFKTGHQKGEQEFGRVMENLKHDKGVKPTWYELWENIQCRGIIRGFKTKAEAQKFEEHLSSMLGEKDFSLCENVSGITEFRVATNDREIILDNVFNN
jgi:hypothetical protein